MTHGERRHVIKRVALLLFAVAMVSGVVAAQAQTTTPTDGKLPTKSAKEVRGATPYVEIENEPPPKLIVDPLLPEGLSHLAGVFWAQSRVENVRIAPVFGTGGIQVSPCVGHLHITVDDLPWW